MEPTVEQTIETSFGAAKQQRLVLQDQQFVKTKQQMLKGSLTDVHKGY